jgi:DnaJ-class molecular chaperone
MILAYRLLRHFSADLKPAKCYYKVLNVPTYATTTDIRVAYLDLVKKYHPDINKSVDSSKTFGDIQKAY